jgi:hypothetical protein
MQINLGFAHLMFLEVELVLNVIQVMSLTLVKDRYGCSFNSTVLIRE